MPARPPPCPIVDDAHDGPAVPDARNIVIYVDESGFHGDSTYYGFGSLWVPWDRRGDLAAIVDRLRTVHKYANEAKWVSCADRPAFYRALIEEFFAKSWIMFHCLLARRADVDRTKHNSLEHAQQKHLTMLLQKKITHYARLRAGARYRIRVDKMPYSYPKTDEVVEKVLAAQLREAGAADQIHDVRQCDSHGTVGVQLADVLLGTVLSAWQRRELKPARQAVADAIATELGWPSLQFDTRPAETKFNVWHFYDPQSGEPRIAETRDVKFRRPDGVPRLRRRTGTGGR